MSLARTLANICPAPGSTETNGNECNLIVVSKDGVRIPCHSELLHARCQLFPSTSTGSIEVSEQSAAVFALLRWVYCGSLPSSLSSADQESLCGGFGHEVARLASSWGLRDKDGLLLRLARGRRQSRKACTLVDDVLRAYDDGSLGGYFAFRGCDNNGKQSTLPLDCACPWLPLLRSQSTYFGSMLSGAWSESSSLSIGLRTERTVIDVHWPHEELSMVMRFLHGGNFVKSFEDVRMAVDCAKFFGVASLLSHVRDWIADHLEVDTAPSLWCFVDSEPALSMQEGSDEDIAIDTIDIDAVCFDYHVQNFDALATVAPSECNPKASLCGLSIPLMHKLMSSGRISMPTRQLLQVVEDYVRRNTEGQCGEDTVREKLFLSLCPPQVLFNRENVRLLLGRVDTSINAVL